MTPRLAAVGASAGLVLAAGVASGATPPTPQQSVARAKAEWLGELRASAKDGDRAARFPSPGRAVLLRRLRIAEQRYGFALVDVHLYDATQTAPAIVIASNRQRATARIVPKLVELFDPRSVTKANPQGDAYEGYFLVAQTTGGVPYLATFNFLRAPHVGGGEWAATESLYPFPHG